MSVFFDSVCERVNDTCYSSLFLRADTSSLFAAYGLGNLENEYFVVVSSLGRPSADKMKSVHSLHSGCFLGGAQENIRRSLPSRGQKLRVSPGRLLAWRWSATRRARQLVTRSSSEDDAPPQTTILQSRLRLCSLSLESCVADTSGRQNFSQGGPATFEV